MKNAIKFIASTTLFCGFFEIAAHANPYLAKPGEAAVPIRIATSAISGGFMHLHTALDNRLFDKYSLKQRSATAISAL